MALCPSLCVAGMAARGSGPEILKAPSCSRSPRALETTSPFPGLAPPPLSLLPVFVLGSLFVGRVGMVILILQCERCFVITGINRS